MLVENAWEVATGRDDLRAYVMRQLASGIGVHSIADEVRVMTGVAVTPASIRRLAA